MELLAYVRVSTRTQKIKKTHITQEVQIEKWAELKGHTIIKWYRDLAVSGADVENRPQFQLMTKEAEHTGDGIIAYKLSRVGRNARDVLNFAHIIKEDYQKELIFVKDNIDTTSITGKFLMTVLSAVAELYKDITKDQTQAGRDRARDEGRSLGGQKKVIISQRLVLEKLKKGNSPEDVAKMVTGTKDGHSEEIKVSGKLIRRRMEEWILPDGTTFMEAYNNGEWRPIY